MVVVVLADNVVSSGLCACFPTLAFGVAVEEACCSVRWLACVSPEVFGTSRVSRGNPTGLCAERHEKRCYGKTTASRPEDRIRADGDGRSSPSPHAGWRLGLGAQQGVAEALINGMFFPHGWVLLIRVSYFEAYVLPWPTDFARCSPQPSMLAISVLSNPSIAGTLKTTR